MGKVRMVAVATGRIQEIPEHWVDHPVLGAAFKPLPSAAADAAKADNKPAAKKAAAAVKSADPKTPVSGTKESE